MRGSGSHGRRHERAMQLLAIVDAVCKVIVCLCFALCVNSSYKA